MTDAVKSWIEERQAIRSYTTEAWEHDRYEDGGSFWAGGGRSDFHLTVDDAAFCVDAHRNFPRALDALNKVLELHKPEFFGTKFDAENEPYEVFVCKECETYSPCPTVQAIEGAINE